jgi:hypothetical protein
MNLKKEIRKFAAYLYVKLFTSQKKKESTIVVLLGNPRGGTKAWESLKKNLIEPYDADLAICFGEQNNKSGILYQRAKYIWEIKEYEKWEDYYFEHFKINQSWIQSFNLGKESGFSGLFGTIGSGAIFCAFLHYVYNFKIEVLLKYERIIITRADFFYIDKLPILSNKYFWTPSGNGYGGIYDRFHMFPSLYIHDVLGIVNKYINSEQFLLDFKDKSPPNLEKSFLNYFTRNGIIKKYKKFPRKQFLVKTNDDSTRWGQTNIQVPYNDDLNIKYLDEYEDCLKYISKKKVMKIFIKTARK